MGLRLVSDWISGGGIGFSERCALDDFAYVQKASSELVVARRRRGADNGRQHVRVAAADRVHGYRGRFVE
jgi:hypothetical protein